MIRAGTFMGCGCKPTTLYAIWIFCDGTPAGLCHPHLDMWLDNADEDPTMEPAALKFVDGRDMWLAA